MATGESDTLVKTLISVSYSAPGGDNHLLRRERHRIKDETTTDIVTVFDETRDVGEKDDWLTYLTDKRDSVETFRDDNFDSSTDQIEVIDDQINEIEGL